jgi:hypothetical protein
MESCAENTWLSWSLNPVLMGSSHHHPAQENLVTTRPAVVCSASSSTSRNPGAGRITHNQMSAPNSNHAAPWTVSPFRLLSSPANYWSQRHLNHFSVNTHSQDRKKTGLNMCQCKPLLQTDCVGWWNILQYISDIEWLRILHILFIDIYIYGFCYTLMLIFNKVNQEDLGVGGWLYLQLGLNKKYCLFPVSRLTLLK